MAYAKVRKANVDSDGHSPEAAGWRLGMGTLLQGLNSSMIVVAIVAISATFNDVTAVPWLISALYFTAAICSPTFGHLADLFGPKRIYYAGLILTIVASCLGPFSPNIWTLVAVRALIGVGTAAQMPAAVAIVMDIAKRRHGRSSTSVGTLSMLGQVSSAVGPVIGGLIVSSLGWRWIFWVNIPLVVNAALWSWRVPAPSGVHLKNQRIDIDWGGIMLFCLCMVSLLYGLLAENCIRLYVGIILAIGCFIAFLTIEQHKSAPFVDLRFLMSHKRVIYIYIRTIIVNIAFYMIFYGIPQWSESEGGMDATHAGFLMLPNFLAGIITTKLAAALASRWSTQRMRIVGGLLTVISMVIGLVAFTAGSLPLFYVASFFLGLPSGFNVMGNQLELNQIVPLSQLGQATGLFRTMQFVGAAVSTPIVHQILYSTNSSHIELILIVIGGIGFIALLCDIGYRAHIIRSRAAVMSLD